MASTKRHGTEKKRREYSNEANGNLLADWLNQSSEDKAHKRIRELLRDIHFIANAYEEFADEDGELAIRVKPHVAKELAKKHKRMMHLFRSYTFFPLVFSFGGKLIKQWCPSAGPDGRYKGRWPPTTDDYSDYLAVFEITHLLPSDIERVRECSCQKWFFARFSHQRFCSAKCRERAFRSSDEWKAYRRTKAREYYKLHKSGKVK